VPVVDELVTILDLKVSSQGKKEVSEFERHLRGTQKAAQQLGIALSAGTLGLGLLGAKLSENLAENQRVADSLGVNVERLQQLQFAAEQTGGSANSLTNTLKTLNNELNPVMPGEYNSTLVLLFGSQQKLNREFKTSDQLMLALASKFQVLNNQQARSLGARLGLDEGTIRLLQKGPALIQRYLDQAKKLGVVDSHAGNEAIKFQKSLNQVEFAAKNLGNSILTDALPSVIKLTNSFRDLISEKGGAIRKTTKSIGKGLGEGVKNYSSLLKVFSDLFSPIKYILDQILSLFGVHSGASLFVTAGLIALTVKMTELIEKLSGVASLLKLIPKLAKVAFTIVGFTPFGRELKIVLAVITALSVALGVVESHLQQIKKLLAPLTNFFKNVASQTIGGKAPSLKESSTNFAKGQIGLYLDSLKYISSLFPHIFPDTARMPLTVPGSSSSNVNITQHIHGAKDPRAVASQVIQQSGLGHVAQKNNPGFNSPRAG
jgi:hypothetical protein